MNALRVACCPGAPPFVSAPGGICTGLLYDVFNAAMSGAGWPFEIQIVDNKTLSKIAAGRPICAPMGSSPPNCIISELDAASVLFNNNVSMFDVGITFDYLTAERLQFVSSSVPVFDAYYSILLGPKYIQPAADVSGAIFSTAVMYIVGLIFLITLGASILYFLCESFTSSSGILEIQSYSGRLGACFLIALNNLLAVATTAELSNPLSNLVRAAASYMSLFLVALFGAVITSELTAASLTSNAPTLQQVVPATRAGAAMRARAY